MKNAGPRQVGSPRKPSALGDIGVTLMVSGALGSGVGLLLHDVASTARFITTTTWIAWFLAAVTLVGIFLTTVDVFKEAEPPTDDDGQEGL